VGIATTVFTLAYLSVVHIERMVNDYGGWHLGVSTFVMLLCNKLSGTAWNYVDGATDASKLSNDQKKSALRELPSLFEYFTAAISPTEAMAGPLSTFADFRNYVYSQGIFKSIPSTIKPCLKRLSIGILFALIYVVLSNYFPVHKMGEPGFREWNFFLKVINFYKHIAHLFDFHYTWCKIKVLCGMDIR